MARSYYVKGNFLVVPNKEVVLKLRGAALNVYLVIADHANENGECWPNYSRIAAATGYDKRQCMRAAQSLEDIGLIVRKGRARNDGGQTSNGYKMLLIHTPSDTQNTPPSDTQNTPWSDTHVTPELNVVNSTYKELKGRDVEKIDKAAYAKAVRADEAQAQRARAARNRKGSTKSLEELFGGR